MNESKYTDFAADCYKLWEAGYHYLPIVADAYADAAGLLGADPDDGTEADAFTRIGSSRSMDNVEVTGPVHQPYMDLCQDVVVVTSRIADRLYRVGEVLTTAAIDFAESDTSNANELGQSVKEQLDEQIDNRGEDEPQRPEKPSDPHLHDYDDQLLPESEDK